MALPVTIPNTFANATASIPLSQLDADFSTLANAINGINAGTETVANLTATNVSVTVLSAANGNAASPSIRFTDDTDTGFYLAGANNAAFTQGGTGYEIGYRDLPPVGTKTGSYTLATADVGKYVQVGSGGSITIPDGTFAEGDAVSMFNNTNAAVTINCAITTCYIAGTDTDISTANLATRGVATVLFISNTVAVITGNVS